MNLDDLPASLEPAQVVEAYDQAWREGHYPAFLALTTPRLWDSLGVHSRDDFADATADYLEASEGLTMAVTAVDVDGDRATVEITETSLDGSDHVVEKVLHQLRLFDGWWEVDAIQIPDA
ncbi:nuclear transport factor 2 family protein [Demequina activiva]|uniref:Uncharacterized protein n=1 Tax=Demequina activiva TaxID=1582364 RepID=A0A919Q2L7_9MICO|nr:nuclear transport factor 2 family protein [Demequina activiva]GIG53273.1 hypothetical protein Dac01nite_00250 [Demequina activiva]